MINVISAVFRGAQSTTTRNAYQYDYGQVLKTNLALPETYEVQFSNNSSGGVAITQIGNADGVTIPDQMFISGAPIYAWIFLHQGADDGETVYFITIPVTKRAKPTSKQPTPVQKDAINQAIAALNAAVEQTGQDVEDANNAAESARESADAFEGMIAEEYDENKTYTIGDYSIHNDVLYRCTTAITTAEAWTAAHWTAAVLGDDVGDLKSALNDIDSLIFDRSNLIDTTAWANTSNNAVTNNNDGSYTFGTTDYGITVWLSEEQIPVGEYTLFGSPYGYTFVSTSTSHSNAVATNDTGNPKTITITTERSYYVGIRLTAKPSASFTVAPTLTKAETAFDVIDDEIDAVNERISNAEADIDKMLDKGNLITVTADSIQHTLGNATVSLTGNNGFSSTLVTAQNNLFGIAFPTQAKKQYKIKFKVTAGATGGVYLCKVNEYNTSNYIYSWDGLTNETIEYQFTAVTDTTSIWFNQKYNVPTLTVDEFFCSDEILRYKHDITDYQGNEIVTFNKILCIGDSITEGTFNYSANGNINSVFADTRYSYPTFLKAMTGREVVNHGHGGYTAKDWYDAYGDTDLSGYDACIIMLGINDATEEVGVAQFSTYMTNIINKVMADNSGIKIFLATIIPAYSDYDSKFDDYIAETRRLVEEDFTSAFLVDINKYSICKYYTYYVHGHLTAIGYQQLAKEFYTLISYTMHNNLEAFKGIQFIGTEYEW